MVQTLKRKDSLKDRYDLGLRVVYDRGEDPSGTNLVPFPPSFFPTRHRDSHRNGRVQTDVTREGTDCRGCTHITTFY